MKKLSLALLMSVALVACTSSVYSKKGNATIIGSKDLDKDTVELTIAKDNGQVATVVRKYDAHAAVGARVIVDDLQTNQDSDLKTITRYEFK